MATPAPDFVLQLQTLVKHGVEFIVIGGVSAALQGAPIVTFDLDVVHSRAPDNLDRLLVALQALDAFYREHPGRRITPTRSHLASPGHQLLMTRIGPLDLLGTITRDRGYSELLPHTIVQPIPGGLAIRLLDLETLIAIKEEIGRDKDLAILPLLRRTLEEKRKT
jgi:hypothetical protein